jgi:hypothetical protein
MSVATTKKEYKFNRKDFVAALMAILEGGASKSVRYVYLRKKDLAPYAQVKATRVASTGEIRLNHKYLTDSERQRIARMNRKDCPKLVGKIKTK